MNIQRTSAVHIELEAVSARRKLFAAAISIVINVGLVLTEGLVAFFTGSLGAMADAGHSGFDLAASFFAYWGIRLASAPPDRTHHYGHEKFENFSSLIQTGLLMGIAAFVTLDVILRLIRGFELEVGIAPIIVIGITLIVDLLASRYLSQVAKEEQSFALEADSYHFLSDLWAKIAVLIGLGAASAGIVWLDPVAALLVAGFMIYTALRLANKSTRILLDEAPRPHIEAQVRKILAEEAGDDGFCDLRLRQAGKWVFLDLSLYVPPRMTVAEADQRAHRLSARICAEVKEVREAFIHVEPRD